MLGKEPFESLSIETLRSRRSKKWSTFGEDILPAWIAEMDFDLAPPIHEALIAAVTQMRTGYISVHATSELAQACASWLERTLGFSPDIEDIQVIPDVLRGIEIAVRVFSRPASAVVLITPAYPSYFDVVAGAGRQVVEVPVLDDGDRYTLDFDAIDAALRRGAGTVLLCNPHNPIGRVFRSEELTTLSEIVHRRDARVISDEIHAPLVYSPHSHVSYSRVSDLAASHAVTLISAAKGWNIGGLKCAQMILSNAADLHTWKLLPSTVTRGASLLGIIANQAAYENGGPWLSEIITYLQANRAYLKALLDQYLPMLRYRLPEATYLAWIDCREIESKNAAHFFLERSKVALNDGASFGSVGRGHVRLNFATSRDMLDRIVQRMSIAATIDT